MNRVERWIARQCGYRYWPHAACVCLNVWGALSPAFGSEWARLLSCSSITVSLWAMTRVYKARKEIQEELRNMEKMARKHVDEFVRAIEEANGDMYKLNEILEAKGWYRTPVDVSTPDKS